MTVVTQADKKSTMHSLRHIVFAYEEERELFEKLIHEQSRPKMVFSIDRNAERGVSINYESDNILGVTEYTVVINTDKLFFTNNNLANSIEINANGNSFVFPSILCSTIANIISEKLKTMYALLAIEKNAAQKIEKTSNNDVIYRKIDLENDGRCILHFTYVPNEYVLLFNGVFTRGKYFIEFANDNIDKYIIGTTIDKSDKQIEFLAKRGIYVSDEYEIAVEYFETKFRNLLEDYRNN